MKAGALRNNNAHVRLSNEVPKALCNNLVMDEDDSQLLNSHNSGGCRGNGVIGPGREGHHGIGAPPDTCLCTIITSWRLSFQCWSYSRFLKY